MSSLSYQEARRQIDRRHNRQFVFRLHVALFTIALFAFFFWLRALPFGNPIYLIPPTAWALLLIGHWFYKGVADARDVTMERLWDQMYGGAADGIPAPRDPHAAHDGSSYDDIRHTVEIELAREKVKRRRSFFRVNIAVYLTVMLLGWIIIPVIYGPFLTESSGLTIFALSIGGLVQLILHYMALRLDTTEGERALRERLLGRALQQSMDATGTEKTKRTLRLAEDGELLEIVEEQPTREKAEHRVRED